MNDRLTSMGGVLRDTLTEWLEDEIPERGAALSYYVLLSLGPLLVIIVGTLELFLSEQAVRGTLLRTLGEHVGSRAAATVATILERVEVPDLLAPGSLLTLLLLVFGATAAFTNIRNSLNTIWGVEPSQGSGWAQVRSTLRSRAIAFVMIGVTGVVLALSFAITSGMGLLAQVVEARIRYGWVVAWLMDAVISLLLTGLLFAAIYRTLPSVRIRWRTVWAGAFATALIFVGGKVAVAWVIASASWTSYYGPGASIVAFLAWVYFSAQLFFLGAEFTQVWARRRGEAIGQPGTVAPRGE